MSSRTIYLARLLGFYSIAVGLSILLHKQAIVYMVTTLVDDPALVWVTGVVALAVGLAIVLGHNEWRGGALPLVVTVVGWWSLAKGLALLFLPQATFEGMLGGGRYGQMYWMSAALSLGLGAYLVWASWGGGKKA
jgi:hypothetical protein